MDGSWPSLKTVLRIVKKYAFSLSCWELILYHKKQLSIPKRLKRATQHTVEKGPVPPLDFYLLELLQITMGFWMRFSYFWNSSIFTSAVYSSYYSPIHTASTCAEIQKLWLDSHFSGRGLANGQLIIKNFPHISPKIRLEMFGIFGKSGISRRA